ncbi:cyclopropane-fatty-acyl-phospholipid synthase family protein [Longimicrobium sp.]|uniref:cyclopropane-fatty-acyl-phospholipid synthase family protein n=1 Tax=Longimicrobium sp. TaxID=2029185 RepID=UPI002C82B87F|nr:cyclopropane-fatty-acyl-phospholipid synthase family protein [Longimicrobium sp.]HSU13673.1 cyclopropane-fatty-acyl-phospholipid synthase family protein [Longimicrobium sp.]
MGKRDLLLGALENTRFGELSLVTPEGTTRRFGGSQEGESATMVLNDWAAVDAILTRGDIGLGESYMARQWDSPDLKAFLTFCQRNRDEFARVTRFDLVNRVISRAMTLTRHNSLAGSRKNISDAYDYPPELYQSYTDRMMTYSSGWWDGKEMSLEDAQVNKYERILCRIGPPPRNVLEMGCGWGYFLKLASSRGYTVTGCTISRRQYEYAKELNREEIADGRVTLLLEDYRKMPGQYDAVVSTGFFEHVGSQYWVEHFRRVKQYLKPGGVAMIQTMLCNRFDPANAKRLNFFSKYIFPGGEFPSIGSFIVAAEEAGLKCDEHLAFGQDYARTMDEAWTRFHRNLDSVRKLGYDDEFIRKWEFFIAGWYGMFRSGQYNVMQAKLEHYP